MAVYHVKNEGDRKSIYSAAGQWSERCLLQNDSLLWVDEPIWTLANLRRLQQIFVNNPDVSGDSFEDKLKKQLEHESEEVYKLVIELVFVYYLFPRKIKYETKLKKLSVIASWKGIDIHDDLEILKSLQYGLGSTGTFYNTSKFYEISYLILIALHLKELSFEERKEILHDPVNLKRFAESTRKKIGKRVQMQHIFLHLVMPDKFERIASWGHKDQIIKAFNYITDDSTTEDPDEKLLMIRERLEEKYGQEKVDFYDTKTIAEKWRKVEQGSKPADVPKDNITDSQGLSMNATTFGEDIVFENEEVLFEQVTTAILNGKHIILTGPPGTGKSKLAHKVCELFAMNPMTVTASSNWSTYETIGGYRPDRNGDLNFEAGIFLKCFKDKSTDEQINKWLVIDEINRADIDKAFGSLFSVLAGDEVFLPFEDKSGQLIKIKPQSKEQPDEQNAFTYVVPNDWRIIGTMNTVDKSSLYEMSYAFMRRFAFIPVGIPKEINGDLLNQYLASWEITDYPYVDILAEIWKLINKYRKIGPAIVQDIAKHTMDNEDFTSPIILYVLPQFEGLSILKIREFIREIVDETEAVISIEQLDDFVDDFFEDVLF
ncbi:AAA family ATPase [Sporosarcina koreensis]|uniref:AAA family ATPase n=1 Tax=Sporosarcina koreensis TaxID=334735 RepID=A0ABW0U1Z7_9BACL